MRVALTIVLLLAVTSCRTVESEMRESVSTYGNRAHITLHNEVMLTGELLMQRTDELWVVSLQQRVTTVPLRDVYTVEVLDADISTYFTPTVVMLGVPWVIIGVVGTGYTGQAEWLPAGILIGGLLTLLPTAFNEAGMSNPAFTANDIAMGAISQYLRYPFRTVSTDVKTAVLSSYGQATPDTLRISKEEAVVAGE